MFIIRVVIYARAEKPLKHGQLHWCGGKRISSYTPQQAAPVVGRHAGSLFSVML